MRYDGGKGHSKGTDWVTTLSGATLRYDGMHAPHELDESQWYPAPGCAHSRAAAEMETVVEAVGGRGVGSSAHGSGTSGPAPEAATGAVDDNARGSGTSGLAPEAAAVTEDTKDNDVSDEAVELVMLEIAAKTPVPTGDVSDDDELLAAPITVLPFCGPLLPGQEPMMMAGVAKKLKHVKNRSCWQACRRSPASRSARLSWVTTLMIWTAPRRSREPFASS